MKIVSLKIKNFRAYSGEHIIHFDEKFTSFIGKNDAGKSTVFDALDIFFGNIKLDLSDLNIDATDQFIEFSCEFTDIPEEIEIDTSAKTSLNEEYLLNNNGNLELKKVFKCTDKSVSKKPDIFIVAKYPLDSQIPFLHSFKQADLKSLGEKLGVTVENKKINHLWRKALWESFDNLEFIQTDLKIEDFEAKGKKDLFAH